MKKIFSLCLIIVGMVSVVYSAIQYISIYNNFWKQEELFVNGNLDTFLIVLGVVGICLIIVGTLGLLKIFEKKFIV